MNKRELAISLVPFQNAYGDKEALRIAKEIGAKAVDFNTDFKRMDCSNPDSFYSKGDQAVIDYFSQLKELADELGIVICQTHGRGKGFINDKEADDTLIENARLDLLATKTLGAPVCVIHAVTTIYMGPDCDPQLMRDLNYDMFTRILPYAKQYGVVVATETFGDAVRYNSCDFFGNIDEFIKSYNRVCATEDFKDYFKICVDTGHSNKAMRFNNNPTPADVIRMLGNNIVVLHLNDNDTLTDQHKIPGTGTINWDDVFNALDEVGYNGYYNMELDLRYFGKDFIKETGEFALKATRSLLKNKYGE